MADAAGDEADVVHAVFSTLARQRVALLKAVEDIDAQERNKCFSFILGGAMGVDTMPALTWRSAEHIPTVCTRVVETSHPIHEDDLGKSAQRVVRLPKASRIIIRFDPLSQLDTGDFLKIYTKAKGPKDLVWSGGRSEIARRGWPGVDAPGLVIEGETFTIEMSRLMKIGGGEEVAYGYRLIAEAELAPSTVNDMHLACHASQYVCASILSECGGDMQEALQRYKLSEVRQKWEELESLSEKRKKSLGLRSGGCFVATQSVAAEDAWLLGARLDLGSAALSFAARETLRPMPNECFSDPNYQEASGLNIPVSEYSELPVPWARVHCGDLGSLVLGCEAKEGRAPPGFSLALDMKKGIKLGSTGSGHVPFVFHPLASGASVTWREETWTHVAMADLPGHLRKHRRRHEVFEALLDTPEKDPSIRNQPEPWHRSVAGSWWTEAQWYGRPDHTSGDVLLSTVKYGNSAFWLEFEILASGVVVAYRLHEYGRSAFREAVWTSQRRLSLFSADPEDSYELFAVPKALEDHAGELSPLQSYSPSVLLRSAQGRYLPRRFLRGVSWAIFCMACSFFLGAALAFSSGQKQLGMEAKTYTYNVGPSVIT
ncbi:unnamed protein product [Symbiodinium natans]|uniref:Uncharacterized protein n=1 Tax=Symbiodinium natans TaxID=878477 RepID=A0A812RM47_9DINO|nr:unnamed protein product [Symbiodinium natans]